MRGQKEVNGEEGGESDSYLLLNGRKFAFRDGFGIEGALFGLR